MQGHWANDQAYHRCRYLAEYAQANLVDHLRNVCLREVLILDPIDTWLAQIFAPSRLTDTLYRLTDTSEQDPAQAAEAEAAHRVAEGPLPRILDTRVGGSDGQGECIDGEGLLVIVG